MTSLGVGPKCRTAAPHVDQDTGELLRDLVPNPHVDYQPTGAP